MRIGAEAFFAGFVCAFFSSPIPPFPAEHIHFARSPYMHSALIFCCLRKYRQSAPSFLFPFQAPSHAPSEYYK